MNAILSPSAPRVVSPAPTQSPRGLLDETWPVRVILLTFLFVTLPTAALQVFHPQPALFLWA
jgi:hypothetical protein